MTAHTRAASWLAALLGLLLLTWQVGAHAQTLSNQVLQLLSRDNTWTGEQTFRDLRIAVLLPSDTTLRLYTDGTDLFWAGTALTGGGSVTTPHNLLSVTHPDTLPATVTEGALVVGNATPAWSALTIGTVGQMLRSTGTTAAWSTDGSGLTALVATQLTSGTVPLARITGLTNTQIDNAAAIAWSKLSKSGSSLADLTTRSAADLSTGTLANARLSTDVSLLGQFIDNAELIDGTITFAKWNANSCTSGQFPQFNGSAWVCATVTPGSGTVTSVALALPGIFAVSGSPVTGSGTLTGTLEVQTENLVWAGPDTAPAAAPTFRSLVNADLPDTAVVPGTFPKVTVNQKGVVTAGTAQITLTTDVTGILPFANGGTGLSTAGDDTTPVSSGSAWVATTLPSCSSTASALQYNSGTNLFVCATTGGPTHAILSATHSDSTAAAVVRGDLIVGSSVPTWARLPVGAAGAILRSDGTDVAWSTSFAGLTGGAFTGTDTWDPGAIADQAAETVTLTVTGAAVGQTCSASLSTIDSEELLISAFPSAADTVRVVVGNLSGGPLSPGSGILRATCLAP